MDLDIRQYLSKAETLKDVDSLKTAYRLVKGGTKGDPRCFSPELYILCAEQALQLGCPEISKDCLNMYFKGKPPANQFLTRAYLCSGQLSSLHTLGHVDIDKAVIYFLKAIEISKEQPRYHFLVFNASVLYFQAICPFLRPGTRQHLVSSLMQVVKALEDVREADLSWRAQLMLHLVECLVDSGMEKEATSFAKLTSDFIQANTPHLYSRIFSLQVCHKLIDVSRAPRRSETNQSLSIIYKIQKLKCQAKCKEASEDENTKLKEIFQLLMNNAQSASPIPITDRCEFLLELAHLSLQLNCSPVAADCVRELDMAGISDAECLVKIECLKCEIDLHKRRSKMEGYSKSDVEVQVKMIKRLDHSLQSAVRGGSRSLIQVVCATLWNMCLPLLQHNLRKNIKISLLRMAQVLEDSHSLLLEMRFQIHNEISEMEVEVDHLESAIEHLEKAMRLDEEGGNRERLSATLCQLRARRSLYEMPDRAEDRAALLIEQAKRGSSKKDMKKIRLLLINAVLIDLLHFERFALNIHPVPSGKNEESMVDRLASKAQNHTECMKTADKHLKRQGSKNDRERVRLWAALAKTTRRLVLWDVCRAACRFCLLYDDGRWNLSTNNGKQWKKEENPAEDTEGQQSVGTQTQPAERDLIVLLAEIHFINAEATIQKLRSEGMNLNQEPSPPEDRRKDAPPEGNSQWAIYREWVQELSAQATNSFLRAAELGAEIQELWIISNAAVYLWNYNKHMLVMEGQRQLLAPFQKLIDIMKLTGLTSDIALQVLLCNTVAQSLLPGLVPPATKAPQEKQENKKPPPPERGKKGAGKRVESVQSISLDPSSVQEGKKVLELCDYALRLTSGNIPGKAVPIAARKQVIATWVEVKQVLQQPIRSNLDVDDECTNETVMAMTRVLLALQMLLSNSNYESTECSLPTPSELVTAASECKWTDPVVELHVWTHLLHFAHEAQDHDLIMSCSQKALQCEDTAVKRVKVDTCALYSDEHVQEMLSSVMCMRALSLVQKSDGHPVKYKVALNTLLSAVSYAEKAGSHTLCIMAARHYWNACLPLARTAQGRQELRVPMETILRAISSTSPKGNNTSPLQTKPVEEQSSGVVTTQTQEDKEGDLALRAALVSLLFHSHADSGDWKTGLLVLDQELRETPQSRQKLSLSEQRVQTKARLGQSIAADMKKFCDESEERLASIWHRVARCSADVARRLTCYQNAIACLQTPEYKWQKIDCLLEFGEWLYCNHFPTMDALHQIQWAIDLLLYTQAEEKDSNEKPATTAIRPRTKETGRIKMHHTELLSEETARSPITCQSQIGVQGMVSSPSPRDLKDVKQLDGLVRAHTLLATMVDRTSEHYRQHCLLAYSYVLQMWEVSLATANELAKEAGKDPVSSKSSPSTPGKKDKGRKSKEVSPIPPPAEEKPKQKVIVHVVPSNAEEWAQYDCPKVVRQTFRSDKSLHSVNKQSITKQMQSIFFLELLVKELQSSALTHLTLPALHLAEVIARELMENKSLGDLYRLRIAKCCTMLGLTTAAAHHEKCAGSKFIYEDEQMACRKAVFQMKKKGLKMSSGSEHGDKDPLKPLSNRGLVSWRNISGPCTQHIWIDKAELCLSMGLYQTARLLLAEANMVAKDLGDHTAEARSLYLLAVLANLEQKHSQALALLDVAQAISGDEDFWFNLTVCLANALQGLGGLKNISQACLVLKRASGVLKSVLEERQNRNLILKFQIASMEMRRAVLQAQAISIPHPGGSLDNVSMKKLKDSCDILQQTSNDFLKLGHREQEADATLHHAEILRVLAKHCDDPELQQRHLLDAYLLTQKAVSVQEEVVLYAQSLPPLQETRSMCLPAMRRLARFRLVLSALALDMLELVCMEEKQRMLAEDSKSCIQRKLEDFLRTTPDTTSVEHEWLSTSRTLGQVVQAQLETVTGLSVNDVETRAKALCMLGRCLKLLAFQKDPLYLSSHWEAGFTPEFKLEQEPMSPAGKPEDLSAKKGKKQLSKAAEMQNRRSEAQRLLAQASETLAQAIGLSLQHKLIRILADASRNMLECYGQFDLSSAGQYLALYQSCCASVLMSDVLRSACSDTSASQLAALLNLQSNLEATKDEGPSRLLKRVEDSLLNQSKAFRNQSINPNHLNILNELPPIFKILLLQHTEDRCLLYGAFFEKAKSNERQKGKTGTLACSAVARVPVNPEAFSRLLSRASFFKQETMNCLLKQQYREVALVPDLTTAPATVNVTSTKIATHFKSIVQEMEDYLHPILSQLDFPCSRFETSSISLSETTRIKEREEKAVPDRGSPGDLKEYVVLLVDKELMTLPLEALSVLQGENIGSVSRDFSLQFLHNRLHKTESVESDNKKEGKGGKGAKGKGDQSQSMKVQVNRVLPPEGLPVDTHNFKYVVDPYIEAGLSADSPVGGMRQILEKYNQQFTAYWEGGMGSEYTPSLDQLQQWLTSCSGFIFNGLERFLATLPPSKLVGLNLSDCRMVILLDLVQTCGSAVRQSRTDKQKSARQLSLERPVETALLLSLSGVRAIMLNQWHTTLRSNARHLEMVMENLLKAGMTSGQTVHALRRGGAQNCLPGGAVKSASLRADELHSLPETQTEGSSHGEQQWVAPSPSAFNYVIYGLPNLVVT
ncbi:cilia- and flagella-associated protein 46 [Arapaima gigas]